MHSPRTYLLPLLLLSLTAAVCYGQSWNVTNPNLTSVLVGIAFNSSNFGYVCGNGILETTNGASKWSYNGPTVFEEAIYMDIETVAGTSYSISTGLNIDRSIAVYTLDGKNWQASTTKLIDGAFQDAQALSTKTVFLYGSFTVQGNSGEGYAVSNDGGNTFSLVKWDSETQARYGSFVSTTTGWIAGGEWPATDNDVHPQNVHSMSRHLNIFRDVSGGTRRHKYVYTAQPRTAAAPPNNTFDGWRAVISKTTNNGQTWTNLVNYTSTDPNNGYYLNGIWFVNATLGFVAGEGAAGGYAFAFINRTLDGGNTWTTVLNIPGGSLLQVKFLNARYGWAVGGVGAQIGATQQFWGTTDGGNTWEPQSVKYDYGTNIAIISTALSYATLVTPFQTSSVATFK